MGRTVLLLAAVAVGYLVIYLLLKKKIARTLSTTSVLREVREEVNRILVELNQTTHRNVTLLEDRIAALGEMLARADKKIALARREAEKQELADRLYSELAGRRPEPSNLPAGAAATARSPQYPVRQHGASPDESASAQSSAEDRQTTAVRLGQAGLSPPLIARRLGLTLGEVELMLSLAEHKR